MGQMSRLRDQVEVTVFPPQIVTVEELEMLEPMISGGSLSIAQLLAGRIVTPPGLAFTSLKNVLFLHLGLKEVDNPQMFDLYRAAFEPARMLSTWGQLAGLDRDRSGEEGDDAGPTRGATA
jgi:hypothetical protein